MKRLLVVAALAALVVLGARRDAGADPLLTLPQLGVDRQTNPNGPWPVYIRGLNGAQAQIGNVDPILGIWSPASSLVDVRNSALDLTFAGTPNPNALRLGSNNTISFCPALSCVHTPGDTATDTRSFWDHQRTSALISAATQDDGHSEEQTLAVTTTIGTGKVTPYAANKAFALGDNTAVGNAVYRAIQAGTTGANSAPPGTRPTAAQGGAFTVNDGKVRWLWINDAAIDAKIGFYNETNVVAGAGAAWGAAFNYHINALPQAGMFLPGVEFDYANDSGQTCALGVTDCTAIRLALAGSQITEGLQVTGNDTGAANFSSIWGIRVNGDKVASQSAIEVDAAAPIGLGFGSSGIGGQSHAIATIQDASNSPTTLAIAGQHSLASIYDSSTSQNGISLNGTYAGAQITGKNFVIDPNGGIVASSVGIPGTGVLRFGTYVATGCTNAGYVTIQDNTNTPRKVMICG